MSLNIMNPKQLEKQMKIVESRIAELQTEIDSLEKMRAACQILLGGEVDLPVAKAEAVPAETKPAKPKAPKAPKRVEEPKSELSERIIALLRQRDGLTADEIYDELKVQGVDLGGKPVQAVYATLEQNPDLFVETDNGQWRHSAQPAPTAH